MNEQFETARLILRPWKEADAAALYRYAKDPAVGPAAGWPPHTSPEASLEIIRTVFAAPETYAVVWKESGEPVGCCGLLLPGNTHLGEQKSREAEVGYWIGVPYWGCGLACESVDRLVRHAFEDLDLSVVWLVHYDGNRRSRRVAEKCGFVWHHAEPDKPTPLGDRRTEHFMCLRREDQDVSSGRSH